MNRKMLIPAALLVSVFVFSGCAKQEAVDQKPTPSPTPIIKVTPSPTPTITPTPTPTPETTPAATPEPTPTYELPPVPTVYNEEADLNNDGHIEKSEWQAWVDQHPEDLDQDLIITDAEQKAYADSKKPSTGGSTGGTTGGNTGGNSGNTTNTPPPVQTQKPSTPPPVQTPSAEDETFGGSTDDITKWMQEHGGPGVPAENFGNGFDPLE